MSGELDLGVLREHALRPVAEKVIERRRLEISDGLIINESTDPLGLGELCALENHCANGARVCFSANQHLYTPNV